MMKEIKWKNIGMLSNNVLRLTPADTSFVFQIIVHQQLTTATKLP